MAEQSFDTAVLDVNMPVMGGIEAAKIYRMTAMGAEAIPLVALTADATPPPERAAWKRGWQPAWSSRLNRRG